MSRRNQDLVSRVKFEVDSRMANATMQALQAHAEKLNQQVTEVNASIKALGDVPDDNPALLEYRKQLRRLNSDLKDVNTTMKDYTRGVKAAGELYRHYAMGNIEDMSIKAIRAGVNGMKKRYDNLKAGGDPGDAEEMRLIEAITNEADVVMKRFKTDYQHVVEEIARGGTVTEQTLKRTRDGLADLMQTAETKAEKNELTNYWQKVGAAIEAVAVENRRLRGEVADREEAMRIVYATDHDGSQQAIHDAEARADAARRENDELRQRLDLKQQQRRELEQEMDINSMQVRALMDRRDELKAQEKEDRAIRNQRVDDANKELNAARRAAKTQQQAYDEQKQTVEKLRTEVQGLTDDIRKMGEVKAEPKVNTEKLTRLQEEYNQKVERRKQLEQELDAIKNRSWTDDPEKKRLEEEIAKLNELIAVADKYKKKFAKMSDSKYEEGYMGGDSEVRKALHISSDPQKSIWGAADYLKGAYHDRSRASLADFVKDNYPDDNTVAEYQQAAERVAKGIVQNAQENFRRAIYKEIQDGNWTAEAMEQQLDIYRSQFQNDFRNARPGELKDDPEYHYYKYIIEQMEKYIEVARQVEAERGKIAGGKEYLELARQKDDIDQPREGLLWQRQQRDFDSATIKTEDIDRRRKEDERAATEAVTKAKDEETESERKLTEAKKQSTTAQQQSAQSSEQLAQKQEQLSQKTAELNQQQDKLNGMVDETVTANQRLAKAEQEQTDARNAQAEAKKHEGEAVKKVEEELRGLTDEQLKNAQAYSHLTEEINADTAAMQRNITTEQEANREADRLRSGSIDKMEQALARLRESNRKLDPTIDKEEWERGERAIGQLNLRLEELKKQSAELRREPVLDMMTQRMQSLGTLSRDALTETKKFWEAMYDGADNNDEKLKEIQQRLDAIAGEEQSRMRMQGREAFNFFERGDYRKARTAETDEQRKSLIAYRDSLPGDGNADKIARINQLLAEQEQHAKELSGEWMSLAQAQELASKAGTDGFYATQQQMTQAVQAIERQREALVKTIQQKQRDGDATNEEEKELRDLERVLKDLKFEQDNFNMSHKRMNDLLKEPKDADDIDQLKAAIKRADAELRRMEGSLGKNSDQYKQMAEQVRQAKNVMKEMEGQAKASATAWEKAFSRLKTYVVMYMGFNEVWQKVSNTARDLMDLSDRMGEVRKTTGFTADEVGRLSENLKKMDVRTSLTELMSLSASAGQLGLDTLEDVQGFTEAANKLMIALPEMGREAATEMMRVAIATGEVDKIRKQLQEGTIEGSSATAVAMEKIASTIDRLRATSASTAPEITDFVKRVGAVGAQSGITIDQVAALGSTVSSLGMRIEMSATALSRMIPAIRNNAFELAKAIGVTPDTIRNLFDTGRGMEVILMILQRIKDTGMDADSVEQMLGMAGMRDIMKDLNQQGARAGIVFSGLSQNVDELRRQLGVAGEAYEENIAIQQEFDKMNETTAAKWERLKNKFEEMWVSDSAQRGLGVLIDMLRKVVDWIDEDGPIIKGLKMMLAYWAAMKMNIGATIASMGAGFKAMGTAIGAGTNVLATAAGAAINSMTGITNSMRGLRAATVNARREWIKMDAAMRANIIGALVTALGFLIYKIWDMHHAAKEAAAEVGRFNQKIADERKALNDMFEPLNKSNLAQEERLKLIRSINSQYGKYLGYMLSETTSAQQLAEAHALIAKRIREEAYERRIAEQTRKVQESHSDDLNESYAKITDRVRGSVRNGADPQEVADILKGIVDSRVADIKYANDNRENFFTARTTYTLDPKIKAAIDGGIERLIVDGKLSRDNVSMIQKAVYRYTVDAKSQHDEIMKTTANVRSDLRGIQGAIKTDLTNNLRGLVNNIANLAKQPASPANTPGGRGPLLPQQQQQQSFSFPWQSGGQGGTGGFGLFNFGGGSSQQPIAAPLPGQRPKVNEKNLGEVRQYVEGQDNLRNYLKEYAQSISESDRQAAEAWLDSENEVNRLRKLLPSTNVGGNGGGGVRSTVWGTSEPGESINWKEMTAEQLVNRRKQMNDFVNSLQTDTDVKAVLAEDKALMKAFKGRQATMREVVEWYNQQRLMIQDELHARHLTNTGDWRDPKKERGAKKQFRDEMDAYLHELDAYYTERKTRIEQARNDEEITEGEAWRRTIQNDNEWQTRRAELQKLYSRKQQEVTQEELDAIIRIIAERTGDSESFVKAAIAKTNQFVDAIEKSGDKGAAIVHRWMSKVVLDTERSYLKAAQAIGKQMKFIEDTLAKERPYDGITKNLQDNLDKMGVLAAKYRRENEELARQNKEPKYSNEQITAQSFDEMAFYLRQAADAYSIDIDELLRRMVKEGMTATAEEISKSDMLKQAVMGQLRKTYQEVQDAIKKEASQIKKDVEIIWNDDTRGIGGMSMKATFDKALAQLGMQQDSVSRANSLIGAGAASDNVASRLAMKQIEVQMRMQKAQYDMYRVQANQRMAALRAEAEEHRKLAKQAEKEKNIVEQKRQITLAENALLDARNVKLSLGLTLAEETKKEEQQKAELLKIQEESQNRLYTSLREWADLLTSSLKGVFEASHAGDAEYYNELAKLNLTGKGGPGAGTYMVIDDAGTSDAKAHYEYLDERQALERQHEIERENAMAEAWEKLWDDINMKMSEQITDWVNASLQDAAVKDNTDALLANTRAIYESMGIETGEPKPGQPDALPTQAQPDKPSAAVEPIVIPSGSTATEAPKVAATDSENTTATNANTAALNTLTQVITGQPVAGTTTAGTDTTATMEGGMSLQKPFFQMSAEETAAAMEMIRQMWQTYNEGGTEALQMMAESLAAMEGIVLPPWQVTEEGMATAMERMGALWQSYAEQGIAAMQQMSDAMAEMPNKIPDPTQLTEEHAEQAVQNATNMYQGLGEVQVQAQQDVTDKVVEGNKQQEQSTKQKNKQTEQSTKSTYSAMTAAMNMYGTAYQIMSNDNMDMTQKFQMFALQAAGQTAIGMLTTNMLATDAQGKVELPGILGKAASQLGPIAGPIAFAAMTALLGGLMAVAMSSVNKSKSQISQVTGASVGAGRLSTGMLTYAEGNVNELTDPASLTPGRQYNVDGADGKTYRARYMGKGAKTHITNGPEFHLVGEAGREAIIDAKTTRLLQLNETGIWRDIQTLYNGGSISGLSTRRRRGTGVRAFADGNIGEFEEMSDGGGLTAEGMGGFGAEQMAAFQTSLDRNNELLERALTNGIKGVFGVYGPDGIVNAYDTGKKKLQRHGVDY